MKIWTLAEVLEEKMKIPGYAERLERASQELEAEFAAERTATKRTRIMRNVFSLSNVKKRALRRANTRHSQAVSRIKTV